MSPTIMICMTLPERPKDNPANRPETVTSESMRDDIQRFVHSNGNMTDIIKKHSQIQVLIH